MVSVPVVPEVLRWAREERGFSVALAAGLLEFEEAFIRALESGEDTPTLGQLQRMATRYQIALATLLMPAPLPRMARHTLHDFRAFEGQRPSDLTQDTLIAIEEANEFVEVMSEIREADPSLVKNMSAPVYRLSENADSVAQQERIRIGIRENLEGLFKTDRAAFLRWRDVVEDQGIFVYQMKLGADGSRGFAVWDEREVPAIVVDASEGSYGPKSFTIWHEYAHILLRMGGISNQNRNDRTERFCNQFAAAFLMPGISVLRVVRSVHGKDAIDADSEVARVARRFRVSKQAAALRMEDLNLAEEGFYHRMIALWSSRAASPNTGRASHEERLVNKFGARHIEAVLTALDRGMINKMDAYEYTNIKPQYFAAVKQKIADRRATYGQQP